MPQSIPFAEVFCPNCDETVTATEYLRTHEHYAGCPRCGIKFWTMSQRKIRIKTKIRRYGRNYEVTITRPSTVWKEIK